MARTRSQKEKAQGKPSRERRLENAAHAVVVAIHAVEAAVPEEEVATPEEEVVIPEEEVATPEEEVATPEEEVATHEAQPQGPAQAAGRRLTKEEYAAEIKAKLEAEEKRYTDEAGDFKWTLSRWKGEKSADDQYHCPFAGCPAFFQRRADYQRHRNSTHLGLKPYRCEFGQCTQAYAQKGTLDNHEDRCVWRPFHREGDGILPCSTPTCPRTFSDPSSLARHRKEQHGDEIYKCPSCARRIKRTSEFRKHMEKVHDYAEEALVHDELTALRVKKDKKHHDDKKDDNDDKDDDKDDIDDFPPPSKGRRRVNRRRRVKGVGRVNGSDHVEEGEVSVPAIAGPSRHTGSNALLSNDGDFAAVPPPYSPTPRFGEIPLFFPHSDGVASTPGLSSSGPSPSPGVSEVTYHELLERQYYAPQQSLDSLESFERCIDPALYGVTHNTIMSSFSTAAPEYTMPAPSYGVSQGGNTYEPNAAPFVIVPQHMGAPLDLQDTQASHLPGALEGYGISSAALALSSDPNFDMGYGVHPLNSLSLPVYPGMLSSDPYSDMLSSNLYLDMPSYASYTTYPERHRPAAMMEPPTLDSSLVSGQLFASEDPWAPQWDSESRGHSNGTVPSWPESYRSCM